MRETETGEQSLMPLVVSDENDVIVYQIVCDRIAGGKHETREGLPQFLYLARIENGQVVARGRYDFICYDTIDPDG